MADVTIAADFGASLGRAIYSSAAGHCKPELLLLDPQVVRVPAKSIDNYEKYKIGQANPEDSAWVRYGETHFAVGFLAKKKFHAVHCLESLKVDAAIPQTLSIVGSVAQRKNLPSRFSLDLGILLPWNEFRDREKFEQQIATALADYNFRGQALSVQLESLTALPEGGGIFARGRIPAKPGQKAFWLPFAYQLCTNASPQEVQRLARSAVYQLKLHIQYLEDSFALNQSSLPLEDISPWQKDFSGNGWQQRQEGAELDDFSQEDEILSQLV